jgi:hypothetical protein
MVDFISLILMPCSLLLVCVCVCVVCDLVNSDTLNPDVRRQGDLLTPAAVEKLKALCYLKLGTWQMEMLDNYFLSHEFHAPRTQALAQGANAETIKQKTAEQKLLKSRQYGAVIPQVLNYFHAATVCDMQSFRAWHEWAMMNFRVVKHSGGGASAAAAAAAAANGEGSNPSSPRVSPHGTPSTGSGSSSGAGHPMTKHIVAAIEGFFRSIWLQAGGDNSRQDVLRLLALWFEHGNIKEVETALAAGLFGAPSSPAEQSGGAAGGVGGAQPSRQGCISIDTWLAVIPQIIARIHSPHAAIRALLHELLSRIGRAHPQALVYPLTVASKSYSEVRKLAALSILNQMRHHSNSLVNQALLVSSELVRVAILWHELWHEAIEEASRYWSVRRMQHEQTRQGPASQGSSSLTLFCCAQHDLFIVLSVLSLQVRSEERGRDVGDPGASARDDGARRPDASRDRFLPELWTRTRRGTPLLQQLQQIRTHANHLSQQSMGTLRYGCHSQAPHGWTPQPLETQAVVTPFKPSSRMNGTMKQSLCLTHHRLCVLCCVVCAGEIFRKITSKESEVTELELEDVSPRLLEAQHMQLAVPGMYRVGCPVICISYFKPTLKILPTKQHPRRLAIGGSDGNAYDFLLKGHEDLRQDERVVQLMRSESIFLT